MLLTLLTALATGPKSVCLIWDYSHHASMMTLCIPLTLKAGSRTVQNRFLCPGFREGVELNTGVWRGCYSIPPTLVLGFMVLGRKRTPRSPQGREGVRISFTDSVFFHNCLSPSCSFKLHFQDVVLKERSTEPEILFWEKKWQAWANWNACPTLRKENWQCVQAPSVCPTATGVEELEGKRRSGGPGTAVGSGIGADQSARGWAEPNT